MQVFVTPKAAAEFDKIITYLKQEWGEKTASSFIQKTNDSFKVLSNYPLLGGVEHKDIRGYLLTSQIRILYRLKSDKIIIISFFDNRQNPINKQEK